MTTDLKNRDFNKIFRDFEAFTNIVLQQLDLLNKLFSISEKEEQNKLKKQLFENEILIDNFENKLDNHIIRAIVLYKPIASDLRQLFAVYRMVINLERIGDLIIKISNTENFANSSSETKHIIKRISKMVNNSLLSFYNNNKELALETIKKDDEIDEFNSKFLKNSIKKVNIDEESKKLLLNIVNEKTIVSSLERIGDHATNIAEAAIYYISGKNIRHQDADNKENL